jgi:hypothetical protein
MYLCRSEENQTGAMILSVAENRLTIEPVAKRLAAPVHLTEEDMAYPDNTGSPELRKAFARYLEHTQMQVCQDSTLWAYVLEICRPHAWGPILYFLRVASWDMVSLKFCSHDGYDQEVSLLQVLNFALFKDTVARVFD